VVAVVEELMVLFDADIPTQSISKCEASAYWFTKSNAFDALD
jgi:hypothetical protein